MVPDAPPQVGSDAGIQGAVAFAGKDVDVTGFGIGWRHGVIVGGGVVGREKVGRARAAVRTGWLGCAGIDYGAGSRPQTPGWRRAEARKGRRRLGRYLEAVEGGVVELEAEDEGAGGGEGGGLGPGDGGVEVVAVDGGGLVEGEALVGIPVFVLEFDAD